MASCKDCLHVDVCCSYLSTVYNKCKLATPDFELLKNIECDECQHFKDRSLFVVLPCKIGTELFRIKQINGKRFITNTALNSNTFWNIVMQGEFGKTVFLTREEAEQALKEREENA